MTADPVNREALALKIAQALAVADRSFGYEIKLTRLVDGESTYRLTMDGDVTEHPGYDEAAELMKSRRDRARADLILAAIAPPAPSTGRQEDRETAFELAQRILEAATNVCTDPDGGEDDETSVRFTGKEGCDLASALFRLSRPQPVAETMEAVAEVTPDMSIAGCVAAGEDLTWCLVANAVYRAMFAARPSAHGEAG